MSLFPKKWSVPFKGDFLNVLTFLHPQIPDVQIVVSRPNIILL